MSEAPKSGAHATNFVTSRRAASQVLGFPFTLPRGSNAVSYFCSMAYVWTIYVGTRIALGDGNN